MLITIIDINTHEEICEFEADAAPQVGQDFTFSEEDKHTVYTVTMVNWAYWKNAGPVVELRVHVAKIGEETTS